MSSPRADSAAAEAASITFDETSEPCALPPGSQSVVSLIVSSTVCTAFTHSLAIESLVGRSVRSGVLIDHAPSVPSATGTRRGAAQRHRVDERVACHRAEDEELSGAEQEPPPRPVAAALALLLDEALARRPRREVRVRLLRRRAAVDDRGEDRDVRGALAGRLALQLVVVLRAGVELEDERRARLGQRTDGPHRLDLGERRLAVRLVLLPVRHLAGEDVEREQPLLVDAELVRLLDVQQVEGRERLPRLVRPWKR